MTSPLHYHRSMARHTLIAKYDLAELNDRITSTGIFHRHADPISLGTMWSYLGEDELGRATYARVLTSGAIDLHNTRHIHPDDSSNDHYFDEID